MKHFIRFGAVALAISVTSCAFAAPSALADKEADAGPCLAAIAASDGDSIVAVCGALIDDRKALRPDLLKALIARGGVYVRRDQPDRAIADYDLALKLDPAQPGLLNARGELWRQKGDRPRAIGDFAAAIRLDPSNEAARANHKALALEIERLGADMALKNMTRGTAKGPPKPPLK